jgi:hypothetical protein
MVYFVSNYIYILCLLNITWPGGDLARVILSMSGACTVHGGSMLNGCVIHIFLTLRTLFLCGFGNPTSLALCNDKVGYWQTFPPCLGLCFCYLTATFYLALYNMNIYYDFHNLHFVQCLYCTSYGWMQISFNSGKHACTLTSLVTRCSRIKLYRVALFRITVTLQIRCSWTTYCKMHKQQL